MMHIGNWGKKLQDLQKCSLFLWDKLFLVPHILPLELIGVQRHSHQCFSFIVTTKLNVGREFRTVITNWLMKPPPLLRVGVWKLLTLEGYGYQDMSICYWCSAWGHGSTTLKHSSTHPPRCIASILIEQKGNGLYFVHVVLKCLSSNKNKLKKYISSNLPMRLPLLSSYLYWKVLSCLRKYHLNCPLLRCHLSYKITFSLIS
jgi:hypothetical protein